VISIWSEDVIVFSRHVSNSLAIWCREQETLWWDDRFWISLKPKCLHTIRKKYIHTYVCVNSEEDNLMAEFRDVLFRRTLCSICVLFLECHRYTSKESTPLKQDLSDEYSYSQTGLKIPTRDINMEWGCDCIFTPCEQFFSNIMSRTRNFMMRW
jgi:hypothetical protein